MNLGMIGAIMVLCSPIATQYRPSLPGITKHLDILLFMVGLSLVAGSRYNIF